MVVSMEYEASLNLPSGGTKESTFSQETRVKETRVSLIPESTLFNRPYSGMIQNSGNTPNSGFNLVSQETRVAPISGST